jgi:hypothetical protein
VAGALAIIGTEGAWLGQPLRLCAAFRHPHTRLELQDPRPKGGGLSWLSAMVVTLADCTLLVLGAYEVYATVLHARARAGPVSEALSRGAWRAALAIAARLPRERRHRALNRVGPLLLPTLLASLVGLLSLGFALIYLPWMP